MLKNAGGNLLRAVSRFRRVTPGAALGGYLRALRLQLRPVSSGPSGAKGQSGMIVSLTTTPTRARYLRATIASLLDQTCPADRIVLNYPEKASGGTLYPPPGTLGLDERVEIRRCTDEGPLTKLLPTLRAFPEADIVVVDDDVIYPREFLATLKANIAQSASTVLAYRGVRLVPERSFAQQTHLFATAVDKPTPVDIVFGTWGYLLPAGVIEASAFSREGMPAELGWVDDIFISGILARAGIDRKVVPASRFPVESFVPRRFALNQTHNKDGRNEQLAIAYFGAHWGIDLGLD